MRHWSLVIFFILGCGGVQAQECFKTSLIVPSPFLGNHGEIFRTADGAIFEVVNSYEYLYAYNPEVIVCPHSGKMLVEGKTIDINPVRPAVRTSPPHAGKSRKARSDDAPITIVLRIRGCDYFIADGPRGHYVLEWYGGHDPDRGDGIFGEIGGYGFKDIIYGGGQRGRVYVDDYRLSKDSALEKLGERCK